MGLSRNRVSALVPKAKPAGSLIFLIGIAESGFGKSEGPLDMRLIALASPQDNKQLVYIKCRHVGPRHLALHHFKISLDNIELGIKIAVIACAAFAGAEDIVTLEEQITPGLQH